MWRMRGFPEASWLTWIGWILWSAAIFWGVLRPETASVSTRALNLNAALWVQRLGVDRQAVDRGGALPQR